MAKPSNTVPQTDIYYPTGMEDPYIAIENNYVLYTAKDDWFLLSNLSKGVMVRHLNEPVRLIGIKSKIETVRKRPCVKLKKGYIPPSTYCSKKHPATKYIKEGID